MRLTAPSFMLLLLATSMLRASDWPAWRGPAANGYCLDTGFPIHWSADRNMRWRVSLPGPGNSTPIVVGRSVLVTCASGAGARRSLICLNRSDGRLRWEQHVESHDPERSHPNNYLCCSSPVSDGQYVVVWHGSAGVFAYDMNGVPLWDRNLGRFEHVWGPGSSPVLYHDLVILNAGPGPRSAIIALDKRSGETRWRRELPGMAGERPNDLVGSWSTPVIAVHSGRDSLLLSLPKRLHALDPRNGRAQWSCGGLGELIFATPLATQDAVVAMSGHQGPTMAVATDGEGDVTQTHRIWIHDDDPPERVGSAVVVDGCIYLLNERGVAWCMELVSGDVLWKHELGRVASWSSMCYADGRIYVNDLKATTYVLDPADTECIVLARNELSERMGASLALSDGQIFIRTYQHLYCVDDSPSPQQRDKD